MAILEMKKQIVMALDQQTWLLNFYTQRSAEDFPFQGEGQMRRVWDKRKDYLLGLMYLPRDSEVFGGSFLAPFENALRPEYWWFTEGPEKLTFNGAARISGSRKYGFFYDKPSLPIETDFECLQRSGLLAKKDQDRMETEEFQKGESEAIQYRNYILQEAQPPL